MVKSRVRIPTGAKKFLSFPDNSDRLCLPPTILFNEKSFLYGGAKRPGRNIGHPSASNATAIPLLPCLHGLERVKFTFLYYLRIRSVVPRTGSGRTSECTGFYLFVLCSSLLISFLYHFVPALYSPIVSGTTSLGTWCFYHAMSLRYHFPNPVFCFTLSVY